MLKFRKKTDGSDQYQNHFTPTKDRFWSINSQGSLCFSTPDTVVKEAYRPRSAFDHPTAAVIVMIICGFLDFAMFTQLFTYILYDSIFFRVAATIVLLIGFDFGPVYLGMKVREYQQGKNVDKLIFAVFLIAFAAAFLVSVYLRLAARDIVLPSSGMKGSAQAANPLALPWAVFSMIAPIVTSLVSFGISYCTYDWIRSEMNSLESQIVLLKADITQRRAILNEYDAETDHAAFLAACDEEHYQNSIAQAKNQGIYLCDYVRERLKEHLADPAAINELSKSSCKKIMEELDKTRKAIAEYPVPETAADNARPGYPSGSIGYPADPAAESSSHAA